MTDPDQKPDPPPSPWGAPVHRHRHDLGGLFFGGLLLIVGGYFLLTETIGLDLPDIGEFWPVFVIVLGLWILVSSMRRDRR
ncbi:MAG TPA: DUF5668 domain-containing protein [Candidatus Limnocylindrales bacterium]|jgi:hypothetical protein